jgi:precorrin isomerase
MKLVGSLAAAVVASLVTFSVSSSAHAADNNCMMSRAVGLTEAESQAVEDIVCQVVHEQAPREAKHYIRLSAIGGRYVLTILQDRNGITTEKQAVLNGVDEVAVAAPRLVEALTEEKRVADTQTMTNIIASEARTPKKKPSEMHAGLGVIGVGALAGGGGGQGGAQFAVMVGSPTLSFVADLRLAGSVASDITKIFTLGIVDMEGERQLGYASASSGARHHFTDTDFAPFVGVGLALDAISMSGEGRTQKNSGIAGYAEVGLDVLRTNSIGGTVAVRVDVPTFELTGKQLQEDGSTAAVRSYTPIAAGTFALRF